MSDGGKGGREWEGGDGDGYKVGIMDLRVWRF